MPFSVSCPQCGYRFRVPDHLEGKRGKCPQCKGVFRAEKNKVAQRGDDAAAGAFPVSAEAADPDATQSSIVDDTVAAAADNPGTKSRVAIPRPRVLDEMVKSPPPPDQEREGESSDDETDVFPGEAPPPRQKSSGKSPPPRRATAASAPRATATTAAPLIHVAADGQGGEDEGAFARRRRSNSKLGLFIAAGVLGLVAILAVGGGVLWSVFGDGLLLATSDSSSSDATLDENGDADAKSLNSRGEGNGSNSAAADTPDGNKPPTAARLSSEVIAAVRPALVEIEITDATGQKRTGRGFLPGRRGQVASSYTLVRDATSAVVELSDGRRFEVAGTTDRAPQVSLAILKLREAPPELPALRLNAAADATGDRAAFIVHGDDVLPVKIARTLPPSSLPPVARPALPVKLRESREVLLLEHDIHIARQLDGSPLLDADGRVLGVNIFVGDRARRGYAIGAKYLARLLEQSSDEKLQPLREMVAASDLPDAFPDLPEPGVPRRDDSPDAAPRDERPNVDRFEAAAKHFKQLHRVLAELRWRPENEEQYLGFAEFAATTSLADEVAEILGPRQGQRAKEIIGAAVADLREAEWPSREAMARINKLAAAKLTQPQPPGVFAYGRCISRPEDFGGERIDGVPLYAFRLVGTEAVVILPLGEKEREIRLDSQWLILGRKDLSYEIKLSTSDAPEPRNATVVHANYILGQAE